MKLGQSVTAHTAMLANLNQLQCCRQECHAYMSACGRCAGLAVRTESPAQPCQLSLGLQQVVGAGQCLRAPSHSSVNVNWNLLEESSRVKTETTGLFCSLLLFCAPGALYLEQSPAFSGAPEQLLPVSVACAVKWCPVTISAWEASAARLSRALFLGLYLRFVWISLGRNAFCCLLLFAPTCLFTR